MKAPKPLPDPTQTERDQARIAAVALRGAFRDPACAGTRSVVHLDLCRPRRGVWITTWSNLPGLSRSNGLYSHGLLPGWEYEGPEVMAEMIPDLEALAERGERPTTATRAA